MALGTMTRPTMLMLEKHSKPATATATATEDQQLQTVRESEKTGGRGKKVGGREKERG